MGQPKPPQQPVSHHTTKQQQPQPPTQHQPLQPKHETPAQIIPQLSPPPTVRLVQKVAITKEGRINVHRRINSFDSQNSQSNHRTASQISQSNHRTASQISQSNHAPAGGVEGVIVNGINKVIYSNKNSNNHSNNNSNNNHNASNKHRTITTPTTTTNTTTHKDLTNAVYITPMSLFLEELQLNEYHSMLLTDGFRMLTDFQVCCSCALVLFYFRYYGMMMMLYRRN